MSKELEKKVKSKKKRNIIIGIIIVAVALLLVVQFKFDAVNVVKDTLTGKETVIDAYCGIGTIGMVASKAAGQVIGVEVNRDAVRDAIANAKRNAISNIYFHNADAGEFMVEMAHDGAHADVVMMDPPRAGSDEAFLSSVVTLSPKRVVYISCNPQTLARDLDYLVAHGYRVQKIQPVDMFPHTSHTECVVSMTK